MVSLYSADDWKSCLCDVVQGGSAKLIFVVGAGLSWDGKVGVWGVSEIVNHIKTTHGIEASAGAGASAYQEVLGTLKARKGARAVEKTIRRAILASAKACDAKSRAEKEVESGSGVVACRDLQNDPSAWNLPAGVQALADLIGLVESRAKGTPGWKHPCVLSTNFDGLLEIALQHRGINHKSEVIAGDAFPHGIDEQVSVLHLHGYWLRNPTLHDPAALQAKRPSLEAALRDFLRGAQVFVMGYAGWNDIIFGTASTVLDRHQSDSPPEIMWAFNEPVEKVRADDANPKSACGHVITSLAGSVAVAQTTFYCGVNLHSHLPEVVKTLSPTASTGASGGVGAPTSSLALVPYLEALLPVVPKPFQPEFQALLGDAKASKPVGLVGVVALCCRVLEESPREPELRARFSEPAWDLITFMVRELVNRIEAPSAEVARTPGEVLRVPAKTHLLVGLLMAKSPNPRHLLLPGPRGAMSRDDLSLAARSLPFEPGPAEPDRMVLFETLLWKSIFPAEPSYAPACKESSCVPASCSRECHRRDLYARLGADAAKGRPHFMLIDPGSGSAWKDIAARAKEVVFVEPGGSATAGLDEDQLAFLISDFLKLTAKENA